MFTAAKLAAALLFAGLGWVSARLVTDGLVNSLFADGVDHSLFEPSIAFIGLWQGWTVMGKLVGNGYGAAVANGVRTSVQITFLGLAFYAVREMFSRSTDLRYNDFGVAVVDALNLFLFYGEQMLTVRPALVVLIAGGAFLGVLCEYVSRIWR